MSRPLPPVTRFPLRILPLNSPACSAVLLEMHLAVCPFSWNTHILSHTVWESCTKYLCDLENVIAKKCFSFKRVKSPVKMHILQLYTENVTTVS